MDGIAVSLVRYAYKIGYRCNAFFGINAPDANNYACRAVWSGAQRRMIAWALAEAQEEIEQEIDYFLVPKWTTDERHFYRRPVLTRWGHVIAGGVRSNVVIDAGATVDYSADPATVTVNGVTCAVEDIHVYHAGTDIEIEPETVGIVAGTLTISIPWCRLVAPAYEDTPDDGLDYADVATWGADTVDVRCVTNDPSVQGVLLVAPGSCCHTEPCADTDYSACIHLRLPQIGSIDLHRADYVNGVWVRRSICGCWPSWAKLNYLSGLTDLTHQAEDMVIRLAHSKMADEPCGCQVTQNMWKRDRHEPLVLTRERINCPFGLSDGAWWAYKQAQVMKLVRGAVL